MAGMSSMLVLKVVLVILLISECKGAKYVRRKRQWTNQPILGTLAGSSALNQGNLGQSGRGFSNPQFSGRQGLGLNPIPGGGIYPYTNPILAGIPVSGFNSFNPDYPTIYPNTLRPGEDPILLSAAAARQNGDTVQVTESDVKTLQALNDQRLAQVIKERTGRSLTQDEVKKFKRANPKELAAKINNGELAGNKNEPSNSGDGGNNVDALGPGGNGASGQVVNLTPKQQQELASRLAAGR